MLDFRLLLDLEGIDAADVLLIRHTPREPALRRIFPWIVADRPELFLTWQRIQWKTAETAMTKAKMVAAFVGMEAGAAVFAGLSRIDAWREIDHAAYLALPGNAELFGLGMTVSDRSRYLDFQLAPLEALQALQGRLIVGWPKPERSWWRWADRGVFPIQYILEESRFAQHMPPWEDLVLTWAELHALPRSWRLQMSQWRGVYYIFDTARARGYVGSAYGAENVLGRWLEYARTGDGSNKGLRASRPADLLFSVLSRCSPDLAAEDVIAIEAGWKRRLHSRSFGLNEN